MNKKSLSRNLIKIAEALIGESKLSPEIAKLLQSALIDEAKAIIQYQLHAERILPEEQIPFNDVSEHLKEHVDDETEHYKRLYDHLRRNNEKPTFGHNEIINFGDGAAAVVKAHQEAEKGAIETYKKIAELADKAGDIETSQLVQDILNDEIKHVNDFSRYEK